MKPWRATKFISQSAWRKSASLNATRLIAFELSILISFQSASVEASQFGPSFPSHRFPTTESSHLSYGLGIGRSSSNFVNSSTTDTLTENAKLRLFNHRITGEIQPSRKVSLGAILNFDQLKLGDPRSQLNVSQSSLGDQRFWGEFRVFDVLGSSLGLAALLKFPAYKNPSAQQLQAENKGSTVLFGDAQTDFGLMLTGEHWFSKNFRTRADFGFNYRTEGYSGELPFLISAGYVSQKIDFDIRLKGNLSLNNDSLGDPNTGTPTGIAELKQAFAGSTYALASNPWVIAINPAVELWTSPKFSVNFEYIYSLMGANSPHFHFMSLGFTMRWAKNRYYRPKTFQQIDIFTKQDPDEFQGEASEREGEAKFEDGEEILEEPSGF